MESSLKRNANNRGKFHALLAGTNDGVLPTDVLRDVLVRLPANVLCRLRLVCRSWRSLTSDPIFAKAHSSHHPLVVGLRSNGGQPGDRDLEVQFLDPFSGGIAKRIPMEPAWKGHDLSMHHCRICIFEKYGPEKASVLNPATGSITMLPTTSMVIEHENKRITMLAYYVLGWVPSGCQFKALRIRVDRYRLLYLEDDPEQSYHIATLGSDDSDDDRVIRWRVKPCPPVRVALSSLHRAVVNGVAYFLLRRLDLLPSDEIAAFDLATEEWRHPPLRGPLSGRNIRAKGQDRIYFSLANLNNCLVCICSYNSDHHYEDCSMDLWFLVEADKDLWTKRYSLRSASVVHPTGTFIPLWILDDGRVLVWVEGMGELRAYDPRTSAWTNLSIVGKLFDTSMYHGSLLCSNIIMD